MSARFEPGSARRHRLRYFLSEHVAWQPNTGFYVDSPGIEVHVEFVLEMTNGEIDFRSVASVHSNDSEVLVFNPNPALETRTFCFWRAGHVEPIAANLAQENTPGGFEDVVLFVEAAPIQETHLKESRRI